MENTAKPSHIGRKIARIRELRGMKQEALAVALGVSQQTVSNMENSEDVEEKTLVKVAEALGASVEGVKNFSEEAVINYIGNFYDNSTGAVQASHCNFNPLDKLMEMVEKNRKLYERLLEREKINYLERLVK